MNKYTRKRKFLYVLRKIVLILCMLSAIVFGFKSIVSIGANVIVNSSLNALHKPINILLMGGDTSDTRRNVPLIDSIILLTINPQNERGNISIDALSIPRDTRVEYACGIDNKIVGVGKINAAYGIGYNDNGKEDDGINCTVSTVENLLNTKIDYFAYTNFQGLMKIVDAIGGITINVPYDFCEQDSKDQDKEVCLTTGEQTLNGEQALAYARQRKAINPQTGTSGDDWERNIRQQEVIASIFKKIVSNPSQYAGKVYGAIKDGAIVMNLDVGTLSKLANFGVNLYNELNNTLSSQGNLNIIVKTSDFNHKVAIDSSQNVFGLKTSTSTQTLDELYPDPGKNNIYYENTFVNYLNFNYKNTEIPTVKKADNTKDLTIELSMNTIGTSSDPSGATSDQFIDDESLEYYQEFMRQAHGDKK